MNVNNTGGRNLAVTGQVGKWPSVFVWDTESATQVARLKLGKGARAVAACAISPDGTHIATADKHNDHNVMIWAVGGGTGSPVYGEKGGPDPIFDITFTKQPGAYSVWSVGLKHMTFWDPAQGKKKKGLFGQNPRTNFSCVCAGDQGLAYSGASNSGIYVWAGNTCKNVAFLHGKGFVGAITWQAGKVYSGGKDGQVLIIDAASMQVENAIQFGVPVRAVDVMGTSVLVGLRSGSIVVCDMAAGAMNTIMESHNSGEIWGLDTDGTYVYTSADDN